MDKRIRQLCGDRNLSDLVDECKRFREQCLRVQCVDLSQKTAIGNGKKDEKAKCETKNCENEKQKTNGNWTETNQNTSLIYTNNSCDNLIK